MKIALYIGRFQPFHKGHLDALEQIREGVDKIIIAIGSMQHFDTEDNPFSFGERKTMLASVLGDKYELVGLEDMQENEDWLNQIDYKIKNFDIVYTSNPLVHRLFNEKNIQVKELRFNINISGRMIREMIKHDHEKWKNFVPDEVVAYLEKINGIKRIKDVS